ncbi:hypothetical protein BH11PLA1_BH11PLA1_16150 [soil metagenome]
MPEPAATPDARRPGALSPFDAAVAGGLSDSPRPDPAAPRPKLAWQARLNQIDGLMRDMSQQQDPQSMVRAYGERMRELYFNDGIVSLSRRGLDAPSYRITRSHLWKDPIDPWRQTDRLPIFHRGMLGELLYAGKPLLLNNFELPPDDPCAAFTEGLRSALAVPHYENGVATNLVMILRKDAGAFDPETIPEMVWLSSLFGRATSNLVLSRQLSELNTALDREMRAVADIQRSLLPSALPQIPGLDFAAHYQTSKNAGGDYYDFFALPEGRLGMLIADVSGHGTPAAVLMAIMHAIAHVSPTDRDYPSRFLAALNLELTTRYAISTAAGSMFVTAFYAVYDPARRTLSFSSAGHNPPRLRIGFVGPSGGPVLELDQAQSLPLGIMQDAEFIDAKVEIDAGDAIILYTDGLTEACNPDRKMFGTDRLDAIIARPHADADALLTAILDGVGEFAENYPPADDRTIIVVTAS